MIILKGQDDHTNLLPRYHFIRGRDSLTEIKNPRRNFLDSFKKRSMEITMFNTPHGGEAIIIRNKKKAILYDFGEGHDDENPELGKRLGSFLKCKKAKLQAIVASHNHQDHVNAFAPMLDRYHSSILRDDVKFYHQAEERNSNFYTIMMKNIDCEKIPKIPIRKWQQKKINKWNGSQTINLFCGPQIGGKSRRFYRSILMRVPFGKAAFLFTGDIDTSPTENRLITNDKTNRFLKNIDALQITHHGSHNGTGAKFLNLTSSALFFVASAKDKKHDFDPRTERRVERYVDGKGNKFDVPYYPIFNTHWEGRITLRTDGRERTLDNTTGTLFEVETDK